MYANYARHQKAAFVNATEFLKIALTADPTDHQKFHGHWLIRPVEVDVRTNSSCELKGEHLSLMTSRLRHTPSNKYRLACSQSKPIPIKHREIWYRAWSTVVPAFLHSNSPCLDHAVSSEQCYKHPYEKPTEVCPGSRTSTTRWSFLPEMLLFEASGQQWGRRNGGTEGLVVKVRLLALIGCQQPE